MGNEVKEIPWAWAAAVVKTESCPVPTPLPTAHCPAMLSGHRRALFSWLDAERGRWTHRTYRRIEMVGRCTAVLPFSRTLHTALTTPLCTPSTLQLTRPHVATTLLCRHTSYIPWACHSAHVVDRLSVSRLSTGVRRVFISISSIEQMTLSF